MIYTSIRAVLLLILLVSSSFTSLFFTEAHATTNLVTVTASNNNMTTTLKFTNNAGDISDISSVILQIGQGGNFKSFKTDSGWFGIKSSGNTLTFTSTNPIKAGQSANFIIKTDQSNPDITWKALDIKNNELGSGEIGTPSLGTPSPGTPSPGTPSTNHPGILDGSSFRIIPSTPSPGINVRVIGQSFSSNANLDLYIGNNKIDSFTTNNGNFIVTTKIPDDQPTGSVSFFVKDQNGNSKTFTTIIQPAHQRANTLTQNVPLTLTADSIYHRGESKTLSGTATPGSTLTITVLDSNGNTLTTFTTTADKTGHYSYTTTVPIDAPFGEYTVAVSDGKNKVSKAHNIVTSHQIILSTSQQKVDPGKTIIINGTSISNQPVSFRINDPTGNQILAKDVNVTSDGKVVIAYTVGVGAVKGTYKVTASQGTDEVTIYFGVGETVVPQLTLKMDKLNYQNSEKPTINISGPPTSTLNLVIVDPSGKQKFADTVLLGADGFVDYSFNVTSYTPGIYSAVVTRGNDKTAANFAIGLQTGCGQITMKTVKDTYLLGDNIIILGKSNPNCIIRVTLSDPNGVIVKSVETFSDKTGIFSSTDFRIPGNGTPGTWKLEATSGINHTSLTITVKSGHEGISVRLDRVPPIYVRGDIVTISGTGAGSDANVIIMVLGNNSTQLTSLNISSTNIGNFSTIWKIPLSFNPGSYTIQVKSATGQATTNISVQ
ncbi:MAG TPA: hypothetical protein VGR54_05110 [Nitrosopumilaceae archaeon]|nr:hypothetical protein [Nitrosopumilaceae archaeon]